MPLSLWEWLKYWLFVWDKFGFEKRHGNLNFGFDLLALVRFGFLKTETEPKFGFRTSLFYMSLFLVKFHRRYDAIKCIIIIIMIKAIARRLVRGLLLFPSFPFPLIQLGGSGQNCELPNDVLGRDPAHILWIFWGKKTFLVAMFFVPLVRTKL